MAVRKIRWFRVYDDLVDDPKVQRLSSDQFRALINLWCLASANGGRLPDREQIGFKIRMTPLQVDRVLSSFSSAGLLDGTGDDLTPHNWNARQFKSDQDPTAPKRAQRYRDNKRNKTDASRVSSHPPDSETESKTERKKVSAANAAADGELVPPTPEAEYFKRVREICPGPDAGGLAKKLLLAKNGSVALARATVEQASTKGIPREYIAGAIRNAAKTGTDPWLDHYIDPALGG